MILKICDPTSDDVVIDGIRRFSMRRGVELYHNAENDRYSPETSVLDVPCYAAAPNIGKLGNEPTNKPVITGCVLNLTMENERYESLIVGGATIAYLMNNEGKTIERI